MPGWKFWVEHHPWQGSGFSLRITYRRGLRQTRQIVTDFILKKVRFDG